MSLARNLSKFKPSSSGLVETADIADDAVNADKIADNAVTTDRIADDAVTTAKVNPAQTDITSVGTLTSFRSTGIDDNADATAMTIDSNEKVGIGTASPQDPLHTYLASGQRVARFEANSSTSAHIAFKANNTSLMPTIGVKDEDLYLSTGDAVEAFRIDANGHITMPKQPAFHVNGSTQTNITHNATFYPKKGIGGIIYDVNSDITLSDNIGFSPGDVYFFSAPVTGKYMFECRLRFDNMVADITYISTSIKTSNRTHGVNMHSTNYFDATATYHSHQGTVIADLDAGDSAYITIYVAGGTTGTDLDSHSFKGILIA